MKETYYEWGEAIHFTPTDERYEFSTYPQYLKSDHWITTREKLLDFVTRCQVCGDRAEVFHIHHANYENLWEEKPEDLIVVCPECHEFIHKRNFVTIREARMNWSCEVRDEILQRAGEIWAKETQKPINERDWSKHEEIMVENRDHLKTCETCSQ